MYFMPKQTRLFAWMASIKSPYRYLITALFLSGISFGWFYGVYVPLHYKIEHNKSMHVQLQKQVTNVQKVVRMQQELPATIGQLEKEIYTCKNKTGCIKNKQAQLLFVLQEVKKSNLHLSSYQLQKCEKREWCTTQNAHIEFAGALPNIVSFLNTLKTSQRLIECPSLSFHRVDENQFKTVCDLQFMQLS